MTNCRGIMEYTILHRYEIYWAIGYSLTAKGSLTIDHVSTVHTVANRIKWFEHRFQYVKHAFAKKIHGHRP